MKSNASTLTERNQKTMKKKFNIGWGLTNKCNMSCLFCYSENARKNQKECGIEDWKKFVDRNHQYIEAINYGTGENSIIDEFFFFVEYVREKYPAISQALTTNGYVSERVFEDSYFFEVFKNCIDDVDISIDFNDSEKHGDFRGQATAYKWAKQALQLSKNLKKITTIVFVGCKDTVNKENLDGLFRLCKKYDAFLRMNIYRPVNSSSEINDKFILSYDSLIAGLQYINDNYEIVSLSDALLGNVFTTQESIKDLTGISSIRILPDGSIYPSTYLITAEYRNMYSIREADLSVLKFEDFENVEIPKECGGCVFLDCCSGGVYDRRILWYGTLAERDPYCPTRHGSKFPKISLNASKHSRISIHDGYLPTLFFKNPI